MSLFKFDVFDTKLEKLDRVRCPKCNWDGLPSECSTEIEQESWEMPKYTIFLCPKCDDEEGVEFYPSEELINNKEIL